MAQVHLGQVLPMCQAISHRVCDRRQHTLRCLFSFQWNEKIAIVKTGISVVINTRNEEKYLPGALSSVKNLAEEIVVVDMESTDGSVEIAKKFAARIIPHKFVSYVEPVRNFAIEHATGPWILILDPDEEIPPTLAKKLISLSKKTGSKDPSFYRLPRKNIIFSKWIKSSRWWPDFNIRFFQKGSVSWTEIIHDVPITTGIGRDLGAKEELAIIHHHYDSIEKFLLWSNRYAESRAMALRKSGYHFSWRDLIKRPMRDFLSRFFFGEGYKDGVHGLALSLLQGFAELMVYAKAWEQEGFYQQDLKVAEVKKEIERGEKELSYWVADSLLKMETNPIKRLQHRVVRKLSS